MMQKLLKLLKNTIKNLKVFDWILVAFGLTAIIVFAILFFRKSSYITVTVSVSDDSIYYGPTWVNTGAKYWLANSFHKGQTEKNGLGKVQAEVLNVYAYDRTVLNKTVYLDIKLSTVYVRSTNTYTYKGTPVLVGSLIKLNLDNVYANCVVTNVQGYPEAPKQTITVEAQLREENATFLESAGTKGYVADAINTGDVVSDNNGNEMIRVLDKRVSPAEITVSTSDGRVVKGYDPTRKDVFLTLQISADVINGKYFFLHDIPILVDQQIPINTSTVSVFPVVTRFLTN